MNPLCTMMMRPLRTFLLPVVTTILVFVGAGFGCSSGFGANDDETHLELATVDSIAVPGEIASSDTLSVHFYGTVGPNGCYSLERINEERSSGRLTLTPVVRHRTGTDLACTMAVVPLDAEHRAAPPFAPGMLEIVVPQDDQPDVTATVTVN